MAFRASPSARPRVCKVQERPNGGACCGRRWTAQAPIAEADGHAGLSSWATPPSAVPGPSGMYALDHAGTAAGDPQGPGPRPAGGRVHAGWSPPMEDTEVQIRPDLVPGVAEALADLHGRFQSLHRLRQPSSRPAAAWSSRWRATISPGISTASCSPTSSATIQAPPLHVRGCGAADGRHPARRSAMIGEPATATS